MGQTFLTSAGKKITLGKQLGSGGSATVYLTNQKGKIAKIFHLHVIKPNMEPRLKFMVNDFKTGKIQTNLTWKDGYKQQIFTWPEEVLYNSKREFSGFIREDLGGDNDVIRLDYIIKDYYYGKQKWKGFNKLKNKYILAQRLAEVFARFYQEENYQNGDIKPENLMVNKNGYPIIFDIDNVSIKQGKKWLIPDVKMNTPNYRAPEWSEYDVNSDYFTIAVIFYQLLFKLHPYDGGTTTYGELLVPQSIIKGLYVHGPKRSSYIKPHEEHDAILLLPKEIRDLFYRAFCGAANTRPKPTEWASVLLKNMNSIQFNAINNKLQPASQVKIKKRSTRKKKSTGTLFTPKTTSATATATATANTTTTPQKPAFNPQLFNKMRIEYWVSWLLLIIGCAYCGFTYSFLALMVILGVWLSYYVNYLNKRSIKYFGISWNKLLKQNQKNKKTNLYIGLSLITVIALICSYIWFTKEPIKTSNTVGTWYYLDTQFDEYNNDDIERWLELEIIRVSKGQYKYKITAVIDDLKNDRFDRRFYTNGEFKKWIRNNQWRFDKPTYGNEGFFGGRSMAEDAYIEIPPDHWDNYKPSSITVAFDHRRELLMFFRDRFEAKNLKGKRQRY